MFSFYIINQELFHVHIRVKNIQKYGYKDPISPTELQYVSTNAPDPGRFNPIRSMGFLKTVNSRKTLKALGIRCFFAIWLLSREHAWCCEIHLESFVLKSMKLEGWNSGSFWLNCNENFPTSISSFQLIQEVFNSRLSSIRFSKCSFFQQYHTEIKCSMDA